MLALFKHRINRIAVIIAAVCFSIGTLLFVGYWLKPFDFLLGIGIWFVLLAFMLNSFMLLVLLINGLLHYKDYKEHFYTLFLIILNLPITGFYLYLFDL